MTTYVPPKHIPELKKATGFNVCRPFTIFTKPNLKKNNSSNNFNQITGQNSRVKELRNSFQRKKLSLNLLFLTLKSKTEYQSE